MRGMNRLNGAVHPLYGLHFLMYANMFKSEGLDILEIVSWLRRLTPITWVLSRLHWYKHTLIRVHYWSKGLNLNKYHLPFWSENDESDFRLTRNGSEWVSRLRRCGHRVANHFLIILVHDHKVSLTPPDTSPHFTFLFVKSCWYCVLKHMYAVRLWFNYVNEKSEN